MLMAVAAGFTDQSADGSDFDSRIAPLLIRHCLECHRGGGVAPFSLETYEDVSRRAAMCAAVIADRSMPPWFAAPGHGGLVAAEGSHSPWSNDRSLLPGEAESFQAWVDGGKVPGDSDELPLPLRFAEAGWAIVTIVVIIRPVVGLQVLIFEDQRRTNVS